MNCKDLKQLIQAGHRPVIECGRAVAEHEGYEEPGMRARVTAVNVEDQSCGVWRLRVNWEEFAEHNAALESRDYYDRDNRPTLTAREAGYYKPEDWLYVDFSLKGYVTVIDDGQMALFHEWKASGDTRPYQRWLECQVDALRAELGRHGGKAL